MVLLPLDSFTEVNIIPKGRTDCPSLEIKDAVAVTIEDIARARG